MTVGRSDGGAAGVGHRSADFPPDLVREAKAGRTVTVCLPARDEAVTLGAIVTALRPLVARGVVDEVVVMDHASTDSTAEVAARAGATVIDADGVLPTFGPALGKGDVLWRSLRVCRGDVVVWLDADLGAFDPSYVTGLIGPLVVTTDVAMVRGRYERVLAGLPGEGGRVTELTARPALSLLFPQLSHVSQPLGGEYAIRREVARAVPFEVDYGVEMGLLIDVASRHGVDAIAQVELGRRSHRNRPLAELRVQAEQVLRAALRRAAPDLELSSAPPVRPPMREIAPDAGDPAG